MNEVSKHQVRKQLKLANAAIDLIKISQRTQHTSIKEALRKILRGISMIAEIEIEEVETDDRKKAFRIDLMKKAKLHGFSDKQISVLVGKRETAVRNERKKLGILPSVKQWLGHKKDISDTKNTLFQGTAYGVIDIKTCSALD